MGNQQVNTLIAIPSFDGYYFDLEGKIYSDKRGKLKKLSEQEHGGKTAKVYFRVKAKGKLYLVHRMVAAVAYGGEIPPELHVNHLDGDTQNNKPGNLEVVTHAGNVEHAVLNGLYCSGEAWHAARR